MFFETDARSLEGRDTGIIADGINEHTGLVNDVPSDAMLKHYSDIFTNEVATDQILDATNVKFKELILTYDQHGSLSRIPRDDHVSWSQQPRIHSDHLVIRGEGEATIKTSQQQDSL